MKELWIGVLLAVAGLGWVEHLVRRGGGRAWPEPRRRAVTGTLAALLAVLAAAPSLDLRYGHALVPRLIAGALFLLLLVYLAQLLPRLRPLLGKSLPQNPAPIFFWLPLVVYLALMPWASSQRPPDGDEPFNLLVAHSLAYDFDAELTNNYAAEDSRAFMDRAIEPQPGDPLGPNGEMYSRHNVMIPAILAPAYRLGGKYGALAMMCAFAAALAWSTLRLARHFFADRPGPTLIAYFILAFTSPLLLYSHQVWVEIPAALLLTLTLDAVWAMNGTRASRLQAWLPVLIPLALLPLIKIRFVLVVGPVLLLLAWRLGRSGRRLVVVALSASAALAVAILAFNYLRYGNLLKYHNLSHMGFYLNAPGRYPRGLMGLFFDTSFGLFATAPIWLLLLAPSRGKLKPALQLGWIMAPYMLMLIPRSEWYGGWSPPFRYGCVALSLFALVLVPTLDRRRSGGVRLALGALVSATALLGALWTARPGWTYNISDGRSHLEDFLTVAQGLDVARFFPSSVRPNLALWLWPPLLALALVALWRWPRRRSAWLGWFGAALPLLGLAGISLAAHRMPTRVIEVEDPYIVHHGGSLWPEKWVVARTRFQGGWRLRGKDKLSLPIVPGGAHCTLEMDYRTVGPVKVFLRVGPERSTPLEVPLPTNNRWSGLALGSFSWPEGVSSLELTLEPALPGGRPGTILLDRLRLSWSDHPPLSDAKSTSTSAGH